MTDTIVSFAHAAVDAAGSSAKRALTFRAMLDDTADLIEMIIDPKHLPSEEDREALSFQAEAIRTLLKEPKT